MFGLARAIIQPNRLLWRGCIKGAASGGHFVYQSKSWMPDQKSASGHRLLLLQIPQRTFLTSSRVGLSFQCIPCRTFTSTAKVLPVPLANLKAALSELNHRLRTHNKIRNKELIYNIDNKSPHLTPEK